MLSQNVRHPHPEDIEQYEIHLRNNVSYWSVKSYLKTCATMSSTSLNEVPSIIDEEFNKVGGFSQLLQNTIANRRSNLGLRCWNTNSKPKPTVNPFLSLNIPKRNAPLSHLDAFAQNHFETQVRIAKNDLDKIVRKRLERLLRDNRISLVERRRKADEDNFFVDTFGTSCINLSAGLEYVRSQEHRKDAVVLVGLYTDDDIFEAMRGIQSPKSRNESDYKKTEPSLFSSFWSTCHAPFQCLTIEDFRYQFKEMCPNYQHIGADNDFDNFDNATEFNCKLNLDFNQATLSKSVNNARHLSKLGIPAHLRPQIWDLIIQSELCIDLKQYAKDQCLHLKAQVARYDLLIDQMIIYDSEDCKADENYFVFEDMVQDILLLWTRDEWNLSKSPNAQTDFHDIEAEAEIKAKMKGKWNLPMKSYPPNGIFPCSGISYYALIVTFLHTDLESAYITFRELYARYFFKLHTITSAPDGIIGLSVTFESFLKQLDPLLFLHLTHELGCPPVTYAFRWLMYGFVGVLDVEQILLLWDRIIGFDRMEILSALAAAIFVFRRERLLEAKTEKELEVALSDLATIKIIPLLQHYFFVFHTEADTLTKEWKMFTSDLSNFDELD
ncbi:hypothetical protein HDU79_006201 [Rhizoclosmatium sp. JEL0117]|nr:hypothetical protein HDU79_006201 [Rhizoclosmatium sp. JEL0117]